MKNPIFLLFFLLLPGALFAKGDARSSLLLEKLYKSYQESKGVTLSFELITYQDKEISYQTEGILDMQDDCFFLQTEEASVWFDGTTQWALLTGTGEVNISTPEEGELQASNPLLLMQLHKNGFTGRFISEKGGDMPEAEIILKPEQKNQSLQHIRLRMNPKSGEPRSVRLENTDGSWSEITIVKYRTGANHPHKHFVFEKKSHPEVELIDLR